MKGPIDGDALCLKKISQIGRSLMLSVDHFMGCFYPLIIYWQVSYHRVKVFKPWRFNWSIPWLCLYWGSLDELSRSLNLGFHMELDTWAKCTIIEPQDHSCRKSVFVRDASISHLLFMNSFCASGSLLQEKMIQKQKLGLFFKSFHTLAAKTPPLPSTQKRKKEGKWKYDWYPAVPYQLDASSSLWPTFDSWIENAVAFVA